MDGFETGTAWRAAIGALLAATLACASPSPAPDEPDTKHPTGIIPGASDRDAVELVDVPGYPPLLSYPRDEGGSPGRWVAGGKAAKPGDEEENELQRLAALGYVGGARRVEQSGVTVQRSDGDRALNLYSSGSAPTAVLMDMQGEVLHRWRASFREIWPGYPVEDDHPNTGWWRRVHVFDNGELLALFEGFGMLRLDRDSNLLWARPNAAHHDFEVLDDGRILALTREARWVPRVCEEAPIYEDFISTLDADGNELSRFSVLEAFERGGLMGLFGPALLDRGRDIFHTNTLTLIRQGLGDGGEVFRPGNYIISLRSPSVIAVVDPGRQRVVWARRGPFRHQHEPQLLPSGRLLLFDNDSMPRQSAVLELDPKTFEVLWAYRGSPERPFYSQFCGSVARLASGNTLITETDNGRAFEVTRDGRVVWEFYNPERAGSEGQYIAAIAEMVRLPADFPVSWIAGSRVRGQPQ